MYISCFFPFDPEVMSRKSRLVVCGGVSVTMDFLVIRFIE